MSCTCGVKKNLAIPWSNTDRRDQGWTPLYEAYASDEVVKGSVGCMRQLLHNLVLFKNCTWESWTYCILFLRTKTEDQENKTMI